VYSRYNALRTREGRRGEVLKWQGEMWHGEAKRAKRRRGEARHREAWQGVERKTLFRMNLGDFCHRVLVETSLSLSLSLLDWSLWNLVWALVDGDGDGDADGGGIIIYLYAL